MSDFEAMLERELRIQLCPVAAPASLWDRIHDRWSAARADWDVVQQARFNKRRGSAGLILLPAAAILLLTLSVAPILRMTWPGNTLAGLEQLTGIEVRALADGSQKLDVTSSDPAQVRAWMKQNADVDVDLSVGKSSILGARLVRLFGTPVAVVAYRAGGETAALVVSKGHPMSATPHATPHGRTFAWSEPNQLYALALSGAGDPRGACILCHASVTAADRP